jgi:hypothetical protein
MPYLVQRSQSTATQVPRIPQVSGGSVVTAQTPLRDRYPFLKKEKRGWLAVPVAITVEGRVESSLHQSHSVVRYIPPVAVKVFDVEALCVLVRD